MRHLLSLGNPIEQNVLFACLLVVAIVFEGVVRLSAKAEIGNVPANSVRTNIAAAGILRLYDGTLGIIYAVLLAIGLGNLHHLAHIPSIPLPSNDWAAFGVILALSSVIVDLGNYWIHRAMHSRPFWPIHRLHHSDEYVNITTANRVHWIERFISSTANALPAIVLPVTPLTIFVNQMLATLVIYFIHTAAPIRFGRIWRLIFVSPAFHRLHHSSRIEHFNGNYCVIWAFWDHIFGTFRDPEGLGFIATGAEVFDSPALVLKRSLDPYFPWAEPPAGRVEVTSSIATENRQDSVDLALF